MGELKPPICATCGAVANVFVAYAHAGKCTKAAWCETHAAEAGVLDPHGYALLDRVSAAERRRHEATPRCPMCDCSQRDFERQGRFGCPACYGTFTGLLQPIFQRMHRGTEHHGKIPARGADPASMRHRITILQAELNKAVLSEKYEGAAQTRDAIDSLKSKLEHTATPRPSKPPAP